MKISREIKIGFTVLVTIILFIWMYSFLKGKNLLTRTANYYVIYDEISGLSESSPVEISGYKAGVVQTIKFIDDGTGRLLITLSIDKKMRIPVGSIAEITTATLIAGMKIQFIFTGNNEIYHSGDTIPGRLAESLLTRLEVELLPLKGTITEAVMQFDSVITSLNLLLNPEFRRNIEVTLASLKTISSSLATTISEREKELSSAIENLNTFSMALARNSDNIDNAISNLAQISDSLAAADLDGAISSFKDMAAGVALLLDSLKQGKGSAGKLFTDDSLYVNITESLKNLNLLLDDLRKNPKRYVHFSLFGKK